MRQPAAREVCRATLTGERNIRSILPLLVFFVLWVFCVKFVGSECLRCPLDQLPLAVVGNVLCCEHGHSFDIASQGYVNLLSAGDKRSKDPGDSKATVSYTHLTLPTIYSV